MTRVTYKMGPKGQVVIPKVVRDSLGLHPGDRLLVSEGEDEVRIRKAAAAPGQRSAIVAELRGAVAGGMTAALEADRREEREREERGSDDST